MGGAAAAVWSPDGRSLACSSDRGGQSDIYVAAVDGSNETRLTDDPADDWAPSWSPDGQSILFTSDRTGDNDIWEVRLDGALAAFVTDNWQLVPGVVLAALAAGIIGWVVGVLLPAIDAVPQPSAEAPT